MFKENGKRWVVVEEKKPFTKDKVIGSRAEKLVLGVFATSREAAMFLAPRIRDELEVMRVGSMLESLHRSRMDELQTIRNLLQREQFEDAYRRLMYGTLAGFSRYKWKICEGPNYVP